MCLRPGCTFHVGFRCYPPRPRRDSGGPVAPCVNPWSRSVGSCLSARDGARQIQFGYVRLVDGCDTQNSPCTGVVSRAAGVLTGLPSCKFGRLAARCGPNRERQVARGKGVQKTTKLDRTYHVCRDPRPTRTCPGTQASTPHRGTRHQLKGVPSCRPCRGRQAQGTSAPGSLPCAAMVLALISAGRGATIRTAVESIWAFRCRGALCWVAE